MTRLFVAVWPPQSVIDHVGAIPRDGWEGVRWTPERNWHVTLRFIGDAEPRAVIDAMSNVALPYATATVGSRIEILSRTSLVVPVGGVDRLAAAVRQATAEIGLIEHDQRFHGHLTVARSRGRRPISPNRSAAPAGDLVEFDVDEVALVASHLLPDGPIYTTLATFMTSGGDAR